MPVKSKTTQVAKPVSSADLKVLLKLSRRDTAQLDITNTFPLPPSSAIVKGEATGTKGNMTGVYAFSERSTALVAQSSVCAGWFDGDVEIVGSLSVEAGVAKFESAACGNISVTGDITLPNADCAEDFDVSGPPVDAGTVMVMANGGGLSECQHAYDRRVAGVVSGAGSYKPGIVLDRQQAPGNRQPIALIGKVFCKVDAEFGSIEVGDLLTTSSTPGHAMRTTDPVMAFGAVIGKALRPHAQGRGLIPILIALQ
jgi:hypothetical protein